LRRPAATAGTGKFTADSPPSDTVCLTAPLEQPREGKDLP
jgi:hypothetical protein